MRPGLVADRGNTYAGTVHHPWDGDTTYCLLWTPPIQTYVLVGVRVRGVQAPELHEDGGPEVAAAVAALGPVGAQVLVGQVGPYTRPGHVTGSVAVGGVDVAGWLLERGYAVAWDGTGKRPVVPWPPPGSMAVP